MLDTTVGGAFGKLYNPGMKGPPAVALETTAICHGLPWPENLKLASDLEAKVREGGGEPVFIGLPGGRVKIGLNAKEVEGLATAKNVVKASTRDLAWIALKGANAATTVASTIYLAAGAGISIMATGGIGGVHRDPPFDISADLPELARTPIMVVCSGAKSILDLPATREWLETAGIPVIGYQTDEFPAFYSRESGLRVDSRIDTPEQAALLWREKRRIGPQGGLLVTVPVPADNEYPRREADRAIESALQKASAEGITGKDVTPFLLREIAKTSGGRSLHANLALLKNNALIAGRIALALDRMSE